LKSGLYFLLLVLVIFTLGLMDTFSTVIAISATSFTGYESNALYSDVYANSGILSFIALKLLVTTGFALAAFLIQKICSDLKILYVCVSLGLIVVGILVSASNLVIATGSQNMTILSMNTLQFSLFCLAGFLFIGITLTALHMMTDSPQKPGCALYRDQFGMWLPYDDD
jgi:hypothetical protein